MAVCLTGSSCTGEIKVVLTSKFHQPDLSRDGVGDGQIPYVVETEVKAIEEAFKDAGMSDVKFTYIIVSKRINHRFFTGPQPDNPHSGTIVDDVVTLPER